MASLQKDNDTKRASVQVSWMLCWWNCLQSALMMTINPFLSSQGLLEEVCNSAPCIQKGQISWTGPKWKGSCWFWQIQRCQTQGVVPGPWQTQVFEREMKEKCLSWPADINLLFVPATSAISGVTSRPVSQDPWWKLLLITFWIVINAVHPLATPPLVTDIRPEAGTANRPGTSPWGLCCALQKIFSACVAKHTTLHLLFHCKWLSRTIALFYNTVLALKMAWIWSSYVILNQPTTSKNWSKQMSALWSVDLL